MCISQPCEWDVGKAILLICWWRHPTYWTRSKQEQTKMAQHASDGPHTPSIHLSIQPSIHPSIHPSLHPHKLYACTWLRKSEVSYYLFCTLERFFIIFNFTISHFSLTGKVHCTLEQREGSRPQPPGSRESESSLQWALGTRGSSIALNSTNSRS